MNGEIQISKFPVLSAGGCIVSVRGFYFTCVFAYIPASVIYRNTDLPLIALFIPRYAKVSGRPSLLGLPVAVVIFAGARADIAAPVVKAIMVDMVNVLLASCPQYGAVHTDGTSNARAAWPISTSVERMFATDCVPTPLHKPLVIGCVYNGHLALRQRNSAGIGAHRSLPKAAGRGGGVRSARRPYPVYQEPIVRKLSGVAA